MSLFNESPLISDEDSNVAEGKLTALELSDEVQQQAKPHLMLESINCSYVNHKFLDDSGQSISIYKINSGTLTEDQVSELKGKHMKVKSKYEKLYREHSLLKSKCEKQQQTRTNRMSSSVRYSNPQIPLQNTNRKMVSVSKNCQLVKSVQHPAALSVLEYRYLQDKLPPLLKDTKTMLLFQEATKLQDLFNAIKADVTHLEEWMRGVTDDRWRMMQVAESASRFSQRITTIQDSFQLYKNAVEEFAVEARRTCDAFETYKKSSNELMEYHRMRYEELREKNRVSSNRTKSEDRLSEIDTTSGFRQVITRTFIDFPQIETQALIQKVLHEELDEIDTISEGNQQIFAKQVKRKLEEYIRSIYSIKQLVESNPVEHSYLDNETTREWMSIIRGKITKFTRTREFLSDMYKAEIDSTVLQQSFKQNIGELFKEISKNKSKFIQRIRDLSTNPHDHLRFFATATYSSFTKTLLTNLVNINQFHVPSVQSTKWYKLSMSSARSIKKLLQDIAGQMGSQSPGLREMVREEEEFAVKMVKHIEYLNSLVTEVKKYLIL